METYKLDHVFHAAAHKHVPLMEYNPMEAIKNNVYGSKNMVEAAKAASVKSFVMISTDSGPSDKRDGFDEAYRRVSYS